MPGPDRLAFGLINSLLIVNRCNGATRSSSTDIARALLQSARNVGYQRTVVCMMKSSMIYGDDNCRTGNRAAHWKSGTYNCVSSKSEISTSNVT